MDRVFTSISSGLPSLDRVLNNIRPGDNIVFQVESIDDYLEFTTPFCERAHEEKRDLIYFRFAEHGFLLPEGVKAEVHEIDPEDGFENFIHDIFTVIERHGAGACYLFDCLSELSADWYSDRMLANFFMLTCPYLYAFETVTYFALLKHHHMSFAVSAIHDTAQIIIDVYNSKERMYIHPLKVYKRHSPTMYMLHRRENGGFIPVTSSAVISDIMASTTQPWLNFSSPYQDVWTRTFANASSLLAEPDSPCACEEEAAVRMKESAAIKSRIIRMAITRDERVMNLANEYFSLADVTDIGRRMIGTGLIGGKSVGMLLARAMLRKKLPDWDNVLESHDSFYICSDVFYTYLITNGCWWLKNRLRMRLKESLAFDEAKVVSQRLLAGTFPVEIEEQFAHMLDYFGQSPIIVRSSSLLEDAYGNAFSGKYESVFCANQGTPRQRLEFFMNAVRTVYASTMSEEALAYRQYWGMLDQDEQMAILVQRVSGNKYGRYFFPHIAGVGFSYNPYVWSDDIDPKAGMLRLVFGLGTRAVDRADDDYTRVVALNAPLRRPEATIDEVRRYAQRRLDLLDLESNELASHDFSVIARECTGLPLGMVATRDSQTEQRAREIGLSNTFPYILTFEELFTKTGFIEHMKSVLSTLHAAYDWPVDIEFTANFLEPAECGCPGDYRINIVQCRPFQVKGELKPIDVPVKIDDDRVLLRTHGPIIGNSTSMRITRLVYIVPATYGLLGNNDRYMIARLVGKIVRSNTQLQSEEKRILLVGPGRWGTTTPSLGVPVSFAEISRASAICEIATMHDGLVPDVSLGTHFFNDLVEMDILYFAIYPDRNDYMYNANLFETLPNALTRILPDAGAWAHVIKIVDADEAQITLIADTLSQKGICYCE